MTQSVRRVGQLHNAYIFAPRTFARGPRRFFQGKARNHFMSRSTGQRYKTSNASITIENVKSPIARAMAAWNGSR